MPRTRYVTQRCRECDRGREVRWTVADEYGTSYLCPACEQDRAVPEPAAMQHEEPDAILN